MVTSGFYDSINHDRRYRSVQFGSIFDGIVRDGIFMSIGTCFRVIPGEDMMILVGIGRAWFDHTWIYNDAPLPLYLDQSEVILDRIDAIVIDVNSNVEVRENTIKIVKGIASKTPQEPTLINNSNHHQYPLAYISVRSGVTSIRAADITSMIGTSETPYVTGILETVNIDALLDQWKDQWKEFYENQTADIMATNAFWKEEWENFYNDQTSEMAETNAFWKNQWQTWYDAQTKEMRETYEAWEAEWELWSTTYKNEMTATAQEWKDLWNAWFYSYVTQNEQQMSTWQQEKKKEYEDWFESLKAILEPDVAANLAARILDLESCCAIVKDFMDDLGTDHAVYPPIYDSSGEPILDSSGNPIVAKVIFVTK